MGWKAIAPDEVLFTVMIKAYARRKEAERAMNILGGMKTSGLYPTDITYTEMIHACSLRPDFFNECFGFFAQMKAEDIPVTKLRWRKGRRLLRRPPRQGKAYAPLRLIFH
eukprot:GHVS01066224.1.p3 GENE.GHVS01066224.1~~GHVS01066224.1.p3  ORF type:complete len:110 (+),score=15.35 GHVS01066224.1:582-911(+)